MNFVPTNRDNALSQSSPSLFPPTVVKFHCSSSLQRDEAPKTLGTPQLGSNRVSHMLEPLATWHRSLYGPLIEDIRRPSHVFHLSFFVQPPHHAQVASLSAPVYSEDRLRLPQHLPSLKPSRRVQILPKSHPACSEDPSSRGESHFAGRLFP